MRSFFRFLSNHKVYSVAEICGLSIALAFVILVSSFVLEDNKCDRKTRNADRLFLLYEEDRPNVFAVATDESVRNGILQLNSVESLIPVLKSEGNIGNMYAESGSGQKGIITALLTGQDFFNAFGVSLIEGDPDSALGSTDNIVVSEDYAKRIFGEADPVGMELDISEGEGPNSMFNISKTYRISGVFTPSGKSVIPVTDVIFRYEDYADRIFRKFSIGIPEYVFILLKEGADLKQAETDFANLKLPSTRFGDGTVGPFHLEPLRGLNHRLSSENAGPYFDNLSDYGTFRIFLLACIVILVFAILNYIMLSVAFSRFRLREMATRRLLGTQGTGVAWKCYAESFLLLGISFVLGVLIAMSLRQPVSDLLELEFKPLSSVGDWMLLALLFAAIGIIAGLPTSLAVLRYQPVGVIKGEVRKDDKMIFGKAIVALQGFVCTAIVAFSACLFLQTDKMIYFPRGYEPENNIFVDMQKLDIYNENPATREELESLPFVEAVGQTSSSPAYGATFMSMTKGTPGYTRDNYFTLSGLHGSEEVFDMLGIKVLEDFHTDSEGMNRLYVCKSSWDRFTAMTDSLPVFYANRQVVVSGVIDDTIYGDVNKSSSDNIMGFLCDTGMNMHYNLIKVKGNETEGLRNLKKFYADKGILDAVSIQTLNQQIEEHYRKERKYQGIMIVFALLSILLTCLGLVALSSYWAQVQTRNTAIQKIFGCSRKDVFSNTVRSFIVPVLIGAAAAVPLAFHIAGRWLEQYAVRIGNSAWIYIAAATFVLLLVISAITISAVDLMNTNPAEVLKKE